MRKASDNGLGSVAVMGALVRVSTTGIVDAKGLIDYLTARGWTLLDRASVKAPSLIWTRNTLYFCAPGLIDQEFALGMVHKGKIEVLKA